VTSPVPASTLATTGISTGTITEFGNVFVNGTRFDTDRAEIFVVFPVAAGTILDISGHRQADGSLLALYIEQKALLTLKSTS